MEFKSFVVFTAPSKLLDCDAYTTSNLNGCFFHKFHMSYLWKADVALLGKPCPEGGPILKVYYEEHDVNMISMTLCTSLCTDLFTLGAFPDQ